MTTKTFPLTGPIDLVGRVAHGSFRVDARDDVSEATVTISAQNAASLAEAVVEMRGSTLVVMMPRQGGIFDLPILRARAKEAVDIEVVVPSGTPVKISSYTAAITIDGRVGSADLASGAASVEADEVDGDLRLRFGSGNAHVQLVRGDAQSRAGSGNVDFGEVTGALTSACGSGDLTVGTSRGSVRTRAGSGDVRVGVAYGDVDFVSGSGSIVVGVPAGTSARLDVTSGSGRVQSEMPVESQPATNERQVSVRIRTGSGDIRLVRAAA
ncbi:MAG TPA: DUF4097 family beta strand repeat-containing protein [Jatrophihabitantaceae bacterium]|nr:DUF4097 family beta strand repeat-containing protein [Jatrophihabitantaceae bacterium]